MDGKVCRYQAVGTAHQKRGENRAIGLDVGFLVLVIAKILIAILPDVNGFLQLMRINGERPHTVGLTCGNK
jgi:hypothetical protein